MKQLPHMPLTEKQKRAFHVKKHDPEEIAEIIKFYNAGATYEEIKKKYNVASSTFKHWCNKLGVVRNRRTTDWDAVKKLLK